MGARAKRAVRSKRMSERCKRTRERTSEWLSTYVPILGCSKPPCNGLECVSLVAVLIFFSILQASANPTSRLTAPFVSANESSLLVFVLVIVIHTSQDTMYRLARLRGRNHQETNGAALGKEFVSCISLLIFAVKNNF